MRKPVETGALLLVSLFERFGHQRVLSDLKQIERMAAMTTFQRDELDIEMQWRRQEIDRLRHVIEKLRRELGVKHGRAEDEGHHELRAASPTMQLLHALLAAAEGVTGNHH
jgi:hypothetical protein